MTDLEFERFIKQSAKYVHDVWYSRDGVPMTQKERVNLEDVLVECFAKKRPSNITMQPYERN